MNSDEYALIHLADDEWGNETMWRVAKEFFDAHPECEFVEVSEHAGWYLGYRRDGSTWSTANDMAVLQQPRPYPRQLGYVVRRGKDGHEYSMHTGYKLRLAECA